MDTTNEKEKQQKTNKTTGVKKLLSRQEGVDEIPAATEGIPQIGDLNLDSDMDVDDETVQNVGTETEEELLEGRDNTDKPSEGLETAPSTSRSKKPKTREEKELSGYKSSRQFIKKMNAKDKDSLSDREKALVRKHAAVVAKFEKKNPRTGTEAAAAESRPPGTTRNKEELRPTATASRSKNSIIPSKISGRLQVASSSKRQRSAEDKQLKVAKKAKPSTSVDEVAKELQVAIIDKAQIDGSMSTAKWLLVEAEILKALSKEIENGNVNCCNFANVGWSHGVKTIDCRDPPSRQFLIKTVSDIGELWTGASLEVISRESLPLRRTVKIWIPPPNVVGGEQALIMLAAQNKEINMSKWKIKGEEAPKNGSGKILVVWADEESCRSLKEKSDILNYGLGKVHVKNYIHDDKGEANAASGANKPASL